MGVLTLDQIAPDGLLVVVDWSAMQVGSSVFVPCINTTEALKQVRGIFDRRGWTMRVRIYPEKGIWGVRFWRLT
jgi:hypothetical protein